MPVVIAEVDWYIMPQFRWPELGQDISLAREVAASRPSKNADWEEIAGTLSAAFSTKEKTSN